jgi:hypothetical protein
MLSSWGRYLPQYAVTCVPRGSTDDAGRTIRGPIFRTVPFPCTTLPSAGCPNHEPGCLATRGPSPHARASEHMGRVEYSWRLRRHSQREQVEGFTRGRLENPTRILRPGHPKGLPIPARPVSACRPLSLGDTRDGGEPECTLARSTTTEGRPGATSDIVGRAWVP